MNIENREFNDGVEVKEVHALDRASQLVRKLELTKQAIAMKTTFETGMHFIDEKNKMEGDLRNLLPLALSELGEQIEKSRKFGDVTELEAKKDVFEKLLLDLSPPAKQEVADTAAFERAVGAEYGGALNKMEKRTGQ